MISKRFFGTLFLLLAIMLSSSKSYSQELLWDLDFMGFFDNREFKPPTQTPQTLFGTRLTPLIGVRIQECHELMGGVSYIQEFGSKKSYKVDPSVFYKYNTESFKVSFGAFPRRSLIKELP